MSRTEACCTCATLLTDTKVPYDADTEKPLVLDRKLDCCGRTICATCQWRNRRFETYCPFCQISTEPSVLPPTGLRLPPSYNSTTTTPSSTSQTATDQTTTTTAGTADLPPAYNTLDHHHHHHHHTESSALTDSSPSSSSQTSSSTPPPKDTVHHLSPSDTIASLSLAYSVPAPILRTHNTLYSDSLLPARKTLLIPHTHYTGPPLSTPPDPVEEERKNKVRRWMVGTKCADYKVAELYLRGCGFDLESAIESYRADERWEGENPMARSAQGKSKGRSGFGGGGLVGQLS